MGVFIIGGYLTWAHYIPTKQGALVDQPQSAIDALYMGISIIPVLFFVCNLICMYWYRLDAYTMKAAYDGHEAKAKIS